MFQVKLANLKFSKMGDGPYFLFPTLTCGVFVFSSVSAPPPSSSFLLLPVLPVLFTHSLTHPLTHSLTQSLTDSLTHSLSRGRMYAPGFRWRPWVSASFAWQAWGTMCTHSHTHSITHSLTHSHIPHSHRPHSHHSHTPHSHTPHSHHSLTLSLTCLYMHIHTHTHTHPPHHHPSITPPSPLITHPPSPLHHSYPSPSLLAFLCSV